MNTKINPSTSAQSMGASINKLFAAQSDDADFEMLDANEIRVHAQGREEFEDETQTLSDLGDSLAKRWGQPIIVNRVDGVDNLVAGERRLRAAKLKGIKLVPARVFHDLTPEEVDDLQRAENNHRKNLTQMEEARQVKKDLENLGGDTAALLAKYNKNKTWLSKTLAILDLGPVTSQVVAGDLSADKEVLLALRTVEKHDPAAAQEVVETLRKGGGKVNAREVVNEAKNKVKPGTADKKPRKEKEGSKKKTKDAGSDSDSDAGGSVATPPDLSHTEPSDGVVFSAFSSFAGTESAGPQPHSSDAGLAGFTPGQGSTEVAISELSDVERTELSARLEEHYVAGRISVTDDPAKALFHGMSAGHYGSRGEAAMRLSAFMQGVALRKAFDLDECLQSVKAAALP